MADSVTANPFTVTRDGTVTPQVVELAPGQTVELAPGQTVELAPGQIAVQAILSAGTAPDGTVTLDGIAVPSWATLAGSTYTLNRDIFCTSLTINPGVTLISAGYRIFAGTLTVSGTLHNNGDASSGAASGFYGGGANGGNGGTPAFGAGANGTAGSSVTNALGGAGGHGGNASGGGGGAAGGTSTSPAATAGGIPRDRSTILRPTVTYQGGAGGGGAGSFGNANGQFGGAGGGGGGILAVFADGIILNAGGAIQARGAPGSNGSPTNGGGGGGGGGGYVLLYFTTSLVNNGTIDANGGAGGAGAGGAANGTPGSAGHAITTAFAIP